MSFLTGLAILATLLVPGTPAHQASSFEDLLLRLADAPVDLRAPAIAHYLNLMGSAPFIEGDSVVFLAEGDGPRAPRVVGDFNAWGTAQPANSTMPGEMTRIEGTQWYYLRLRVEPGSHIQYLIARGDHEETDSLNPRTVEVGGEKRSELRIPR
jgi:hypothetical protein